MKPIIKVNLLLRIVMSLVLILSVAFSQLVVARNRKTIGLKYGNIFNAPPTAWHHFVKGALWEFGPPFFVALVWILQEISLHRKRTPQRERQDIAVLETLEKQLYQTGQKLAETNFQRRATEAALKSSREALELAQKALMEDGERLREEEKVSKTMANLLQNATSTNTIPPLAGAPNVAWVEKVSRAIVETKDRKRALLLLGTAVARIASEQKRAIAMGPVALKVLGGGSISWRGRATNAYKKSMPMLKMALRRAHAKTPGGFGKGLGFTPNMQKLRTLHDEYYRLPIRGPLNNKIHRGLGLLKEDAQRAQTLDEKYALLRRFEAELRTAANAQSTLTRELDNVKRKLSKASPPVLGANSQALMKKIESHVKKMRKVGESASTVRALPMTNVDVSALVKERTKLVKDYRTLSIEYNEKIKEFKVLLASLRVKYPELRENQEFKNYEKKMERLYVG